MTAFEIVAFVLCLSGMIVAAASEVAMSRWATPRARLRSWLMWGGLGAALTGLVGASTELGLDAAMLAGLAIGVLCQPLGHTLLWLGEQPGVRDYLNRDRGDAGNRFSITIGFWTWPPPPPRPSRPAIKPAPPTDPAPGWFLRGQWVVTGVLLAAWPLLTFMADAAHEPARLQTVVEVLRTEGFPASEVRRAWTSSAPCWGGVEYAWTAEAGDGRACVRDGDYVTVRVERDRTSKDPFARPAT